MGEREDVLGQLHPVVTGVERAGDTARCTINRQEVPPRKALTGADVVLCSLIVFIFYQYHLVSVTHWVSAYTESIVLDTERWFVAVAY